jgi:hypothetical protein
MAPVGFGARMRLLPLASALLVASAVTPASAAIVWTGDFETGDLSQFNYVLNGQVGGNTYASATNDVVLQGRWAAYIELHDDAVWPNGLRRVELQHLPDPARTAAGATTCLGWSFHLPEALPQDPGHTLGYWESQNSYQQMMAFNTNGQSIRFITQQPNYTEHWSADGVLTPGVWHRIAMCVLWSEDPAVGSVDVWFDGEQVVTAAAAKTLADGNPHFAQLGLLRGDIDYGGVVVIHIDDVLEGDAIEDVDPPDAPGGSDSSGGDGSSGPGGLDTGDSDGGHASTSAAGSSDGGPGGSEGSATALTDDGSGSSGPAAGDGGEGSGCGCRTRGGAGSAWAWWLVPLGLAIRGRRRAVIPALLLGPLACTTRPGSEDDATSSAVTTTATTGTESTGAETTAETTGAETTAETATTAAAETTAGPAMCESEADYTATAEVLDEGLGPTGAPVTIVNCASTIAYVRQDCCYGAAFQLERKDTADGPWRTSMPALACDCEGFVEPLVIEAGGSIVVETNPAAYDAEPICQDPYSAIYRWTFSVGPEPDCTDCWQAVPTNEFSWYCEG